MSAGRRSDSSPDRASTLPAGTPCRLRHAGSPVNNVQRVARSVRTTSRRSPAGLAGMRRLAQATVEHHEQGRSASPYDLTNLSFPQLPRKKADRKSGLGHASRTALLAAGEHCLRRSIAATSCAESAPCRVPGIGDGMYSVSGPGTVQLVCGDRRAMSYHPTITAGILRGRCRLFSSAFSGRKGGGGSSAPMCAAPAPRDRWRKKPLALGSRVEQRPVHAPRPCRRHVDRVGGSTGWHRLSAGRVVRLWDRRDELAPRLGKDAAQPIEEPIHFVVAA